MQRRIEKYNIVGWILLIGMYLLNTWLLIKYGKTNINADMSSEMVLSNLMNEDNDFVLCSNWSYSTEIRIVYLQIFYRIGLLLFPDNWFCARVFSNMIIMLILLVSFMHLCKTLNLGNIAIWLSIILISPFSYHYYTNVGFGCAYAPHLIIYIVLSDLLIMALKRKNRIIDAFLMLLGFVGGANGIRIMYNYLFPVTSTIIVKEIFFNKDAINIKQLLNKYLRFLLLALSICLGFLINNFYLKANYSFYDYLTNIVPTFSFSSLYTICAYLFFLLGFSSVTDIVSGNYICLLSLPFIISLFVAFMWFAIKGKEYEKEEKYILIGVPLTVVELILIYIFTGQCHQRYWITIVPFLLIYIGIYIKKINRKKLVIFIALCMLSVSYNTIKDYMNNDSEKGRKEVVNYLLSNELNQGCASFWNANTLIELSNGEIDVWDASVAFDDNTKYELFNWLQEKRHFTQEPNSSKVFLIINSRTDHIDTSSIEKSLAFSKGTYKVYVFDDFKQIKDYLNYRQV